MRFNLSGRKSNGHNGMLGIWDFMLGGSPIFLCFYPRSLGKFDPI